MSDLFNYKPPEEAPRYPHAPATGKTDTSAEAAARLAPNLKGLQAKALNAIRAAGSRGLTACELAATLQIDRMAIQPRTTELKLMGLIGDSGQRRKNASGINAIVWTAKAGANDQAGEIAA